jgi:hypothetical protein
MKTNILKNGFILLLVIIIGFGCKNEDLPAFKDNPLVGNKEDLNTIDSILIKNTEAEVFNNDSQAVPANELIWYFKVDEKAMLTIQPYRGNYLIPVNLPEDFKIKGLKIIISGKVMLHELSSISQSDPSVRLASYYKFEILIIKK